MLVSPTTLWEFEAGGRATLLAHARGFTVAQPGREPDEIDLHDLGRIQLTPRFLRTDFALTRSDAADTLRTSFGWGRGRALRRAYANLCDLADRYAACRHQLEEAKVWRAAVLAVEADHRSRSVWLPHEVVDSVVAAAPDWREWRSIPQDLLNESELEALNFLGVDPRQRADELNEIILRDNLHALASFFREIESSPLTEEQSRAVVCMDNRVLVVAAAGSGKTSVMVARAAYAVKKGLVDPQRILLLAFNSSGATELGDRVSARFAAAGLDAIGVEARTFHSFGLQIIGSATGRKPRPAPWLEAGGDVDKVLEIVDQLRDSSPSFRYEWDLYRLIFARTSDDIEGGEPDDYDNKARRRGYGTLSGLTVKSQGERSIADFMFLSGVEFEYERPYSSDVSSATHSQYHPDFYYPGVDVWHEHWGLDRDGNAPSEFVGYAESMAWKREIHEQHGTTLVETTWAGVMDPLGLQSLQEKLEQQGLAFDWNPDRVENERLVTSHDQLARLVRSFMSHVKSNSLDQRSVADRLRSQPRLNTPRTHLFLRLYWQIHEVWQTLLRDSGYVDFEDMLTQAAELIESGRLTGDVDMVLVDEFQDASHARARLVQALVAQPGKFVLAVGDDWQSVNRFAGADLSAMTDFHSWFGEGPTLPLSTTFRCSQEICDVSSAFVARNPRQISKRVVAVSGNTGVPVRLRYVATRALLKGAVRTFAQELVREDAAGPKPTLDVLGRYRRDQEFVPASPAGVEVKFRTVHGAKGLEADYVVLPNVGRGLLGFPSGMTDDPVLGLAMTDPDSFPHAEERRLFYVALTRARRGVLLLAVHGHESPFLVELLEQGAVTVDGGFVSPADAPRICTKCHQGTLIERSGPYGTFLGCSRFPQCNETEKLEPRLHDRSS